MKLPKFLKPNVDHFASVKEAKMDAERRKEFEIQNGFTPIITSHPLRKYGSPKYSSREAPRYTNQEMSKMGMVRGKLRPRQLFTNVKDEK